MRIYDLKQKEVINVKTCKRLGFVGDVDFDMETGCLLALIVPGPGCICGFFGPGEGICDTILRYLPGGK